MIGGARLRKTNSLLNLISYQSDVDQIYLYMKDLYEAQYQLLIKHKSIGLKHCNDSNAFIEYLNDMGDIYIIIDEYNPISDMIAGML